jgi:hypothetical protein
MRVSIVLSRKDVLQNRRSIREFTCARHAAERGWISPDALAEIGDVAHAEAPAPEAGTKQVNRELSVEET